MAASVNKTKKPVIIAFANQKGGVGKTSSSCAFAVALKAKGYRVLAIDMDPTGCLSFHLNVDESVAPDRPSIHDVLVGKCSIKDAIYHLKTVDVIASNMNLSYIGMELTLPGKEHRLKEVIEDIKKDYDYIIIDSPPSLDLQTVMALACADQVIVPSNAEAFSAVSITRLKETIDAVKKHINKDLCIAGILLTRVDERTVLATTMKVATENLGNQLHAPIFQTVIRQNTAVGRSQLEKTDLFTYEQSANAAKDYVSLVEEYLGGIKNANK